MGKHGQTGRAANDIGNVDFPEVLAVNAHGHVVFAEKAICYNDGCVNNSRRKAVQIGHIEVVNGIVAHAAIEGIAVREKGLGAAFCPQPAAQRPA